MLLVAGFAGGFAVARTVVQLDHVVRERFEGRLFRVPSRVLSAPTILYPGLDWKQIELPGDAASASATARAASAEDLALGRYAWKGSERPDPPARLRPPDARRAARGCCSCASPGA